MATHEPFRELVGWLRCLRGVDTVTAVTVVTDLFVVSRFDSASKLMGYLGPTPLERTSGEARRGGITKAGGVRVRVDVIGPSGKR